MGDGFGIILASTNATGSTRAGEVRLKTGAFVRSIISRGLMAVRNPDIPATLRR
ncbi:hypothetical protein CHELA40_40050 [Chelatococcus asaccharovorans]|nr:hypothetical protein CHELA17_50144 [Chelatococcus asaccharovorans]CAH1689524.1 hypothetical protein CHELA40_40050 [Chelatococcus asaccharovorans]